MEVETVSTVSPGVIPFGIPLVEVTGRSASREAHPKARGSHSLEPVPDRNWLALLLGDIQRFKKFTLPELIGLAYSFADSVSATHHPCNFSLSVLATY